MDFNIHFLIYITSFSFLTARDPWRNWLALKTKHNNIRLPFLWLCDINSAVLVLSPSVKPGAVYSESQWLIKNGVFLYNKAYTLPVVANPGLTNFWIWSWSHAVYTLNQPFSPIPNISYNVERSPGYIWGLATLAVLCFLTASNWPETGSFSEYGTLINHLSSFKISRRQVTATCEQKIKQV